MSAPTKSPSNATEEALKARIQAEKVARQKQVPADESATAEKEQETKTDESQSKPEAESDPNPTQETDSAPEPTDADAKDETSETSTAKETEELPEKHSDNPVDTLSFYGQPIHRVKGKKRWYFVLEDIIAQTGTLNLAEYLNTLRKSEVYVKNAPNKVISLSVELEGKTQKVECTDYSGFEWLLPILRADERFFPGPFPGWMLTMSTWSEEAD